MAGTRAYRLARAGATPGLAPRPVTVRSFSVLSERRVGDGRTATCWMSDVAVTCSSGTYIRALARDLGEALGVGGHVTALRRTRAGAYDLSHGARPWTSSRRSCR